MVTSPEKKPAPSAEPDLSVTLGPLHLRNPLLTASGTWGGIHDAVMDCDRIGGVVTKTVTMRPRTGNPTPRIWETASGMLNSIGLENKGVERFISDDLPRARSHDCALVVSVAGETEQEYADLVARLDREKGIDAYELNLSCPNVSHGLDFGTDPQRLEKAVRGARKATGRPVFAKLTPNVTDVLPPAEAALEGGADALSLSNTLKGLAIDWRTGKSRLGGGTGGLSGPAVKPVALRIVWEVHQAFPEAPLVGIGGISTAEDVLEFVRAGARAVQLGTILFADPERPDGVLEGLPCLLQEIGASSLTDLIP